MELAERDHAQRRWSGTAAVTLAEFVLRVVGKWRYVMTPSGGFEVAFHGEYREIVPNERIVNTEVYEMPGAPRLPAADEPVNLVTFTEVTAARRSRVRSDDE